MNFDPMITLHRLVMRQFEGVTLYNSDCLEMLNVECDAVITDPPYGIRHSSSHGASWADTEIENDHSMEARDAVWNYHRDKPRAMFGSWKQPAPPECRGVLVYDKGDAGSGDLSFPWKPSWEEIYVAGKGWAGKRDRAILQGPQMTTWETGAGHDGKNGRLHPHEKPVWVMARLIEKLPANFVILDPFMGSGTTIIACLRLGRKCVGIEKDPKHYATAVERIGRELQQGVLLPHNDGTQRPGDAEATNETRATPPGSLE